jgi:hypothetical protein
MSSTSYRDGAADALKTRFDTAVDAHHRAQAELTHLACALLARTLRREHPAATTLTLIHASNDWPNAEQWADSDGTAHVIADDLACQMEEYSIHLLGDTWHHLCRHVNDRGGRYILDIARVIAPETRLT